MDCYDLFDYIDNIAEDILQKEILKAVKKEHIKQVKEKVYTFSPDVYTRRENNGGLIDPNNMIGYVSYPNTLCFENITPFNPDYGGSNYGMCLMELIEYGDGYSIYNYTYPYGRNAHKFLPSRPAMSATEKALSDGDTLYNAFVDGLNRNGINIVKY